MAFGARSFDTHEIIEVASSADFDLSVGTVGGWFKSTSHSGNYPWLHGRADGSASHSGLFLFINTDFNGLDFVTENGSGSVAEIQDNSAVLNDGIWHHVAAVFTQSNGGTNTLYRDGVSRGTANNSAAWTFNSQVLRWAVSIDTFWGGFGGSMADWFWSSAQLTAGEIAGLAAGARPKDIRGLISYWPLDGVSSPEPDLAGKAHNGTLTGTTNAAGPPVTLFTPRWPIFTGVAAAGTAGLGALLSHHRSRLIGGGLVLR